MWSNRPQMLSLHRRNMNILFKINNVILPSNGILLITMQQLNSQYCCRLWLVERERKKEICKFLFLFCCCWIFWSLKSNAWFNVPAIYSFVKPHPHGVLDYLLASVHREKPKCLCWLSLKGHQPGQVILIRLMNGLTNSTCRVAHNKLLYTGMHLYNSGQLRPIR